MNYFYEALDESGKMVMGKIDGINEMDVRSRLSQMGYETQAVAPIQSAFPQPSAAPIQQSRRADLSSGVSFDQTLMASGSSLAVSRSFPNPAGVSANSLAQTNSGPRTGGIILSGNAARTASKTGLALNKSSRQSTYIQAPNPNASTLGGVSNRDRLLFFQQLTSLIKSGITIHSALDNLAGRTKNANLSKVAHEMADAARNGKRVSDVMDNYPRIFEEHIPGLIRAGELGGFLEIVLAEITQNYEQNIALYRGAWIPKLMATQALFGLAIAIPFFPCMLASWNVAANLMLYLRWELVALPTAFVIFLLTKFGWNRMQLPQFRRTRDNLTLKIPPFGDLHRQAALAEFIRMLRRLYQAGVAPIHAWEGAMNTASNVIIRDRLASSYDLMQKGASLSDAFTATGLFTDNIEQLMITGHQSGEVVESLDMIADYYQERVAEAQKKSKFMLFRLGLIALLVLGGAAACWMAYTYGHGIFTLTDPDTP